MKKPVRMKKLRIILHKDKKEKVLRQLFEDGRFQLETVEIEGAYKHGEKTSVAVDVASLLSKIEGIKGIFKELGIETGPDDGFEKVLIEEKDAREVIDEIKVRVDALYEQVRRGYSRIEEIKKEIEELESYLNILKALDKLNIDWGIVKDESGQKYNHVSVSIGTLPTEELEQMRMEILKVTDDFTLLSHPITDKLSLVLIITFKEFEKDIDFILNLHAFKKLEIPESLMDFEFPDVLTEIQERIANLEIEQKSILRELEDLARSERKNIMVFQEILEFEKTVDETAANFGRTVETYVLLGWVPVDAVYEVSKMIKEESEGLSMILVEEPSKEDIPPTVVKNSKFSQPLETITHSYGMPDYNEYDPTDLISITFPLIFGFMFGDVGQGLVIALVGYYVGFKMDVEESVKKAGRTIMLAGISATLVGFLYGAVFSLEDVIEPLWLSPVHAATHNMSSLIGVSLKAGVVILSISMLVNIANEVSHHKYMEAAVSKYGLTGIWLLLGGTVMVARHNTDLIGIVKDPVFYPAVMIPLLIIIVGGWKVEDQPLLVAIVEGIFEALVKFLVNAISFVRILILAIIHGALSIIMIQVMEMMPPTTGGAIGKGAVFLLMNVIIIVMELFVSFIQTMRLHYYEIFSKFYKGTGRPFTPLSFIRKYTIVNKKI